MSLIGDAIIQVCNPLRINYSTLMNRDHYLHTHIEARYDWEPDEYRLNQSCLYPKEERWIEKYEYSEQTYGGLKIKLTEALKTIMGKAYGKEWD